MNKQFWHRNASTVLTCLGGAGVVVTSVIAVKATPKAFKKIESAEQEKGDISMDKFLNFFNKWMTLGFDAMFIGAGARVIKTGIDKFYLDHAKYSKGG